MKNALVIAAALALGAAPALAQTAVEPTPTPPAAKPETAQTQTQGQGQAQQPAVKTVSIIDVTELPEQSQAQVAEIEKQRSTEDLDQLRASIDTSPALVKALKDKGASSADVVAARLSQDGNLTIVTRKEG
ncbi:hypothetical protein [Hoeflea olei]|uniref:Uncharacterized protein n=1 Tax=Hoeflea olei TaxID=1480615 RepID=A0A1C1YPN9_9HYPH|nr:hypothetical protein [Hoeflea olei]OCW55531.1 hypothetical protein AWJ14_05930 [Hoeflea olei]